jgi:hypothetical protein
MREVGRTSEMTVARKIFGELISYQNDGKCGAVIADKVSKP